jgi:hypothetical protein
MIIGGGSFKVAPFRQKKRAKWSPLAYHKVVFEGHLAPPACNKIPELAPLISNIFEFAIPIITAIMKFLQALFAASALYISQTLAALRPDLRENVQVAELEPDQRVSDGATEIPLKAYPGSDFEIAFKCLDDSKQFTFAENKHWVACCRSGQRLLVRSIVQPVILV